MLIPFVKLELSILVDDQGHEQGVQVDSAASVFADPDLAKRYLDVLTLAVQALVKEFDDAESK